MTSDAEGGTWSYRPACTIHTMFNRQNNIIYYSIITSSIGLFIVEGSLWFISEADANIVTKT